MFEHISRRALASGLLAALLIHFQAVTMAQPPGNPEAAARRTAMLKEMLGAMPISPSGELARVQTSPEGYLRAVGTPPDAHLPVRGDAGKSPEEAAASFLTHWRGLLLDGSAAVGFVLVRVTERAGGSYVRFRQEYGGLPVFGAEAIVQLDSSLRVKSAVTDIMRDAAPLDSGLVPTSPGITSAEAEIAAGTWFMMKHGGNEAKATPALLMVFEPAVVGERGATRLVWQSDAGAPEATPVRERILVDARTGRVVFHYPLVHDVKVREIYDAMNTASDPGTLVLAEGDSPSGLADADLAYLYFGDTYDFYDLHHGRDSLDGAGATLSATVRYCHPSYPCPFRNAFWDGSRMYFGEGFSAADDVVAHELTHGVTTSESNLIYANQSGAINESFSDIWGEFVDLENTGGTDTAEVRWLLGEDLPGIGAIRDMAHPPRLAIRTEWTAHFGTRGSKMKVGCTPTVALATSSATF